MDGVFCLCLISLSFSDFLEFDRAHGKFYYPKINYLKIVHK